jgi:hypothetical protein
MQYHFKKQHAIYINNNSDSYAFDLRNIPFDYASVVLIDNQYGQSIKGNRNYLPTMEATYEGGRTMGRASRFR